MINRDVLRIMTAKGAGDGTLKKISRYINDNSSCSLNDVCSSVSLMRSMGISQQAAENICNNMEYPFLLEDLLYKNNVEMCWAGDRRFPPGLRELNRSSMPAVLFYKGNFELLQHKCVGFTGSRNVSDSGIKITHNSATQLSYNKITVISGNAKGVDIAAHKAALQSGGDTVFVIAEGILKNRVKKEVKEFLNDKNHLFLSQFMPELGWSASNAMKRNNTIIGLSDAMILIESGLDGGTFNAGQQSLKNNKPLFVVEYAKPKADGNTFFLRHGGIPLRGDRNGKPVLKKVYSTIEKAEKYEQLSLNLG